MLSMESRGICEVGDRKLGREVEENESSGLEAIAYPGEWRG